MATEVPVLSISMLAGADLSAAQYKFVEQTGTGRNVTVCNGVTDKPLGVLQNKPASGEVAEIMVLGMSKVSGDADLAPGDSIGCSADGQAAAYVAGTDTTKYIVGRVIDDNTAAGGIVSALINCLAPARGA